MKVFKVSEDKYIRPILSLIGTTIRDALAGGAIEIILQRPSKTREQEKKYHAMIRDISKTVEVHGKKYALESWKAMLIIGFEKEMAAIDEPLKYPGRVEFSFLTNEWISIRPSSTRFSVDEGSKFIEYIYMTGAEYEAKFSDESKGYYDELEKRYFQKVEKIG